MAEADREVNHPPAGAVQSFMSLGMIANTVEAFSGKDVRNYFEKFEKRSKLDNWSEDVSLNLIKYRLTGEAYNFFKSDKSLDTIKYTEFKNRFVAQFSPIKIPGQALINLGRCYQRFDETVINFSTRVKLLGRQIIEEDLEDAAEGEALGLEKKCNQLVLNQFKIGLRREIIEKVGTVFMRETDLTIEKAVQIANFEELNQLTLKSRNKVAPVFHTEINSPFCSICRKTNHIAADCYFKDKKITCNFCRKLNHTEENCWLKNKRVTHNQTSPRENEVTQVPQGHRVFKSCNFCNRKGHVENECWKKNRNIVSTNNYDSQNHYQRTYDRSKVECPRDNQVDNTDRNQNLNNPLNYQAPSFTPRREGRYQTQQ